jgi:hypothetical protein
MAAWLETCPEPAQPPARPTSCSRGLYIEKYAYAFGKKNVGEKGKIKESGERKN